MKILMQLNQRKYHGIFALPIAVYIAGTPKNTVARLSRTCFRTFENGKMDFTKISEHAENIGSNTIAVRVKL